MFTFFFVIGLYRETIIAFHNRTSFIFLFMIGFLSISLFPRHPILSIYDDIKVNVFILWAYLEQTGYAKDLTAGNSEFSRCGTENAAAAIKILFPPSEWVCFSAIAISSKRVAIQRWVWNSGFSGKRR